MRVLVNLAHTAVRVPDVEAAVRWYAETLGFTVISPPYLMKGAAIEADMGELIPPPVEVKAAIVGITGDADRVLEVIEYPAVVGRPRDPDESILDEGFTHVGIVCDDIDATREVLERRGVEFLTRGIADVAGLRTTWFRDPWCNVFILMEKSKRDRPYYQQY